MKRAARPGAVLMAAACFVTSAGCRTEGLLFRQDKRVDIVAPADRSAHPLPVELRWTVRDFPRGDRTIGGDGNYFAVFVDRQPMRPGQNLRSLGDDDCKRLPGCPDEQWLADRFIYLTTRTSLELGAIPDTRPANRERAKDLHEVTIVLMNGDDRRIGESAFSVEFVLEREE